MTITAAFLRLAEAKGLSLGDVAELAETLVDDMPVRSKGAARQAKYRAKLAGEVTGSDVTCDATCDVTRPPNDIKSNPQESSLRSELVQARKQAAAEFRAAYPRKPGAKWQDATERFMRLVRDGVDPAAIIDGAKRFAASKVGEDPKFTCDPTVFLNKRRWLDDHEPAQPRPPSGNGPRGSPPPKPVHRNGYFANLARSRSNDPSDSNPGYQPPDAKQSDDEPRGSLLAFQARSSG